MTYDKNSFLAGIAVGRQLKGWNLYPDAASVHGWTADAAYLWRNPGLLGHIPPVTELTFEDVVVPFGEEYTLSGNVVTALKSFGWYVEQFPGSPPWLFDVTVTRVDNLLTVTYLDQEAYNHVLIPGTGVFETITTGAQAGDCQVNSLGRGTFEITMQNRYHNVRLYAGPYSYSRASFEVNGVYDGAGRSIVPGGVSIYKKKSGLCIACLVRYRTPGGAYISTPVLISDLQQATEWGYAPSKPSQTDHTGQYIYHGLSWYMSTSGSQTTVMPESDTGAAILDLTGGSAISNEQDLFLAVVSAAGLTIL